MNPCPLDYCHSLLLELNNHDNLKNQTKEKFTNPLPVLPKCTNRDHHECSSVPVKIYIVQSVLLTTFLQQRRKLIKLDSVLFAAQSQWRRKKRNDGG
ncbi:hypothetical protein TNCV_405041 [Trichonephila clavipes]|nr:hypothetical protein TNCV_405041 [Trichonephila clavipes]